MHKGDANELLEVIGIDALCESIQNGESQSEIARKIGVSPATLSVWLNKPENVEQSARARLYSAESWLDRGLTTLESALDKNGDVDASAARAYAQECARRAALRNPQYIEKTAHEHSGTMRVVSATDLKDDELAAIATSSSGGTAGKA